MSDTDTIATLHLITAIGKSLVNKKILSADDIVKELNVLSEGIVFGSAKSELIRMELDQITKIVSGW